MIRSHWGREDQGVILQDKHYCSRNGASVCHGCRMVMMVAVFVLTVKCWFVGVKRDDDMWK